MRLIAVLAACLFCPGLWLSGQSLEEALVWSKQELAVAKQEHAKARDIIVDEKLPLARELRIIRQELRQQGENKRLLDEKKKGSDFEVEQLKSKNTTSSALAQYLENQAIRFRQGFEADLGIGERLSYADSFLEMSRAHQSSASLLERAEAQWKVIESSLSRAEGISGGARFGTQAVSAEGVLEKGTAIQQGPLVFFKSDESSIAGNLVEDESLRPHVKNLGEEHKAAVLKLFEGAKVVIPVDPTLGQAALIEQEAVSLKEHLVRGGFWMIPICLFGVCALLTGIWKWTALQKMQLPTIKEFEKLKDLSPDDWRKQYRGDARTLLENLTNVKTEAPDIQAAELDVAYQEFKFKLNRWLPVIALTAGVSPLLGLLGTVTGMIKTFQLISLFGAGDAKLLSSGISEALITTEFGLVVAIPALIFHTYLQRRVKKILVRSASLLEQVSRRVVG
ncbi:MAG: MotA/TolQ/ExbB proton channel family protein [Verrucomicrobia bacterium]|nr:MotA/TolQ/ExbB proton channel family protein [Verrucomicrobiota bacterium]